MPRGILNVTDAKVTLSRIIAKIKIEGDNATPVVIGRHGEAMAVLISIEQFQEYRALAALALRQPLSPPLNPGQRGLLGRRDDGASGGRGPVSGNGGPGARP
jgi:antitoxin (DNA-binding transcriptional repressor) of toxin-antitoxin stability system